MHYDEPLNSYKIKEFINEDINNIDILTFDTIDSTNTYGKKLASNNLKNITLIVAEGQTAGRGRMGRSFISPKGSGLYMTLVFNPNLNPEDSVLITTAASVAITKAIKKLCHIDTYIKWVNDIIYKDKKLCGILAEAIPDTTTGKIKYLILGIGINFNFPDRTMPKEISDIAISLFSGDTKGITRNMLCAEITNQLLELIPNLKDSSFIDYYKEKSIVLGKEITYTSKGQTFTGIAMDIATDGGLIVKKEDGTMEKLISSEISTRLSKR